jgi:hypothetical protein
VSPESATIWAGIISGIIGGGLAVIAALLAVHLGISKLEQTEIRRLRVECITNLYGLRFVTSEAPARPEDVARYMFELNRAVTLFADDTDTLNELRDFYESVKSKRADATDRMITLIKKMSATTALRVENLSDADVRAIFLLPMPPPPFVPAGFIVQQPSAPAVPGPIPPNAPR